MGTQPPGAARRGSVTDAVVTPGPGDTSAGTRPTLSETDSATILLSQWLTGGGLLFRCVAAPGSIAGFLGVSPSPEPPVVAVLVVIAVLVVLNGAGLVLVFRSTRTQFMERPSLFVADLVIAVGLNLALAVALPRGTQNLEAYDVAWFYLVGSVATWTGIRGPRAGALIMLVGIPLQFAMTAVNGIPLDEQPLTKLLVREIWAAIAFALTLAVLPLYRHGRRLARQEGLRAGKEAERARQLRDLHDTVLQTLEAIALIAGDRAAASTDRLADVRSAARAQAAEIRALLLRDGDSPPPAGLSCALRQQVAAAEAAGLDVRLVLDGLDAASQPVVAPVAVDALRQAVGEALTNVTKHSGVRRATVRATLTGDGVRVSVADAGRGFDSGQRSRAAFGFGLRESVVARMREVDGHADVWSLPGRGTVITLSVPLAHPSVASANPPTGTLPREAVTTVP
jgi:signal transduction histidine kinase